MRAVRGLVLALTVLSALVLPIHAQSIASVEVDSARITVGDRITMTVTVEHPDGAHLTSVPAFDRAQEHVVVLDQWGDYLSVELATGEAQLTPRKAGEKGEWGGTSGFVMSLDDRFGYQTNEAGVMQATRLSVGG